MIFWEKTKYSKWYMSHRRFSFTAKYCIELYEDGNVIPDKIFIPFLKSLYCHSKSEEKMFSNEFKNDIIKDHANIIPTKKYENIEKYTLCKDLLIHMKKEEDIISANLKSFMK